MSRFPRKRFQLVNQKFAKTEKCQKIQLYNYFLKFLLRPNFDSNSFERFPSLSQKTLSTSLLKKIQKSEKYHFQTRRKIVFHLKVASKSFSKKLPMTKFGFE